jgi:hypothetical protein
VTCCVSKRNAPNRGTTSRCRHCTDSKEPRLSPGDTTKPKRKRGSADSLQRRLQGGERRPQTPSPLAPTRRARLSSVELHTSHTTRWIGSVHLVPTPPPPQHLANEATTSLSTNTKHGREDAHLLPSASTDGSSLQTTLCTHQDAQHDPSRHSSLMTSGLILCCVLLVDLGSSQQLFNVHYDTTMFTK